MAGTCGIYEALWLARLHTSGAKALYLHVPFCIRKCLYCDFSSWATHPDDPVISAYLASLERLVHQAAEIGLLEGCETAYVGGGTPTLAGDGLTSLVAKVMREAPGIQELTCEANPDSLSDTLLDGLQLAGCTRLSIGIQSLDDRELAELGRIHTAQQALNRLHRAVATGLSVSCDLMCATPGQTDASWNASLRGVLECGVRHVSVYPLQIEEGTPFDERFSDAPTPWNDPEIQAKRMEQAASMLSSAGLHRYEVASYAMEAHECRHNIAYWTAMPYLGLGTGASSMLTREGYERLRSVAPRLPRIDDSIRRIRLSCTSDRSGIVAARSLADLDFDLELLDERQAAAEDLMLSMRMVAGAGPGLIEHARRALGAGLVDEAMLRCESRHLVLHEGNAWVPTSQGWLLGNELYGPLWDLAPGEVGEACTLPR